MAKDILLQHPLSSKYKTLFDKYGVNTTLRLAHFFGQAAHESDLKPKRENLNYSVDGLLSTFGRHRISEANAKKYGRTKTKSADQKSIANIIYGGSWGKQNLGNTMPNDGWDYRGAGIFQLTGRSNFEQLTKATGIDFISNSDLIMTEANSLIAALWFWNSKGLNTYADKDDILSVSKIINLGSAKSKGTPNGLPDRTKKTNDFKQTFK
jgi:putative chitinase